MEKWINFNEQSPILADGARFDIEGEPCVVRDSFWNSVSKECNYRVFSKTTGVTYEYPESDLVGLIEKQLAV